MMFRTASGQKGCSCRHQSNRVQHRVWIHKATDGCSDISAEDLVGCLSTRRDRSASPRLHPLIAPSHVQKHPIQGQPQKRRRIMQTEKTKLQCEARGEFQYHFRVNRQVESWKHIEWRTYRTEFLCKHACEDLGAMLITCAE